MKNIITVFILVCCAELGVSQNIFSDSQTKYWYYRDRLKYFVMPGTEAGQSVVMTCRNANKDFGQNWAIYKGIETANTHKLQGYYIGMLATEYKLLKDNGQIADANNTLQELNFALDALNRMDYCEGDAPWNNLWFPTSPNYNGFFIRDDYPPILSQQMTEYLNEDLTDGTFQDYTAQISTRPGLPFSIDSNCVSARNKYEDTRNYNYQYPHIWTDKNKVDHIFDVAAYSAHNETYWSYWKDECFTSNDEIIGDLMGLALVANFVSDFSTKMKAIMISYRYFSIMNSPLYQMRFPDFTPILEKDGGYSGGYLWGVASVVNRMLPLIDMSNLGGSGLSPFIQYQGSVTSLILFNGEENFYNRGLYSKLIALSEASPNNPFSAITRIGNQANIHTFYLLLWAVANNKDLSKQKYKYPFNLLISDLNLAPCEGPYNYQHYYGLNQNYSSTGWCTEYKYDSNWASQQDNKKGHNGVYPGVDYMLLYNLACLAFPSGFDYNGQHYSFPYYVNQNDRVVPTYYPYLSSYNGGTYYGSMATPEEIKAISTIRSSMKVLNQALNPTDLTYIPGVYGDVTLKAGESIKLTDGFRVDAGAHFLARIESYSCGGVSYKNMAASPWDENYRGCFYDTLISVPMEKRAAIVYSEDNYEEADFDMPLWEDYYYTYDTTITPELAVGAWLNPNPCGSSATLTVVSESEQQLAIDLYDMTGIKRETVFNDIADQNLVLDLNLSTYASGTYMLRISGNGGMKVMRFVKE